MQKNCAVLITKHQSPKGCQHFLLFLLVIFYRSVKFHYRKNRVTCCVRGRHEKSIKSKRTRRHPFVPYLSGDVLTKFYGKSSNLHTLLIHWNFSRSFSSCWLLTASAAFGKQKAKQNILYFYRILHLYNISSHIWFMGVSLITARVQRIFSFWGTPAKVWSNLNSGH